MHQIQGTDDYERTVYTTWKISYERLTPLACTFIQHCALMHHEGISEDIFRKAAVNQSDNDPKVALEFLHHFLDEDQNWDSLLFYNVTKELQSYSLIDFDNKSKAFSIHPLVHQW